MAFDIHSESPLRMVPRDYCDNEAPCWFTLNEGPDAGKTLFYADSNPSPPVDTPTVLFVHGNPECSYTYRHVRRHLIGKDAPIRMVTPDHIGFGLSDPAHFEMVDMHHAANLRQLIEHLDLRRVILVIHDWGGPIGIGAFLDAMDRVDALVVLNTTIFPMPSDGITYTNWPVRWLSWSRLGAMVPNAAWGGLAAHVIGHANPGSLTALYAGASRSMLRFASSGFEKGTPEYVFSEPLRSVANAKSSRRNVLQTPYWGHGYRYTDPTLGIQDNRAFYQRLQQTVPDEWGIAGRGIPAVAHIGEYDPCGKASVIRQWLDALPQLDGHVYRYADTGHFVEEHKGMEIAESILELATASYAAAPHS